MISAEIEVENEQDDGVLMILNSFTKTHRQARIAPGVLVKLENRNPKDDRGRLPRRHHQWLYADSCWHGGY